MKGFIYKIVNDINDKVYVGQTRRTLQQRFRQHISDCEHIELKNRPLYQAMKKHGIEHFRIELIEECSEDELNNREIYWIEYYHAYSNGYNATLGGGGSKKFEYDIILEFLKMGKQVTEIEELVGCKKDLIYLIANKNNIVVSAKTTKKNIKKVGQYDRKTKVLLRDFPDSHAAAQWCIDNKHSSNNNATQASTHIRANCNGTRKSAYGFVWQYIE